MTTAPPVPENHMQKVKVGCSPPPARSGSGGVLAAARGRRGTGAATGTERGGRSDGTGMQALGGMLAEGSGRASTRRPV